jgi:hypothetical protein
MERVMEWIHCMHVQKRGKNLLKLFKRRGEYQSIKETVKYIMYTCGKSPLNVPIKK